MMDAGCMPTPSASPLLLSRVPLMVSAGSQNVLPGGLPTLPALGLVPVKLSVLLLKRPCTVFLLLVIDFFFAPSILINPSKPSPSLSCF